MQDLIGDVELDDRLRQQGEDDDRKERERRGCIEEDGRAVASQPGPELLV